MEEYRVIIVGGGPSGSLTALSLLRLRPDLAGKILILEARRFPREKVCGGGVSGRVTERLESLGLPWQELPRTTVRGFTVCFRGFRYRPEFGNLKCFVTRRSLFDAFLLKCAEERGAEVRFTAAVGAYREPGRVAVVDRLGNLYRCEVLVGADGVNGRTRAWSGIPARGRRSLLLQVDLPLPAGAPFPEESMILDFSPPRYGVRGYVWFFPSLDEEGRPVLNAGISGGEFSGRGASLLKRVFLEILQEHPEVGRWAPGELRFRAYPERSYSPLREVARDRVIMVGEQVGVDPFTGEGLAICADSAHEAARHIASALESGDYSFRGYAAALRRAPFFPLYLIGLPYWYQSRWRQPCFLLAMSTRKGEEGAMNVLDYYARTFSGSLPPGTPYSAAFWKTVARDAAAVFPGWLRRSERTCRMPW